MYPFRSLAWLHGTATAVAAAKAVWITGTSMHGVNSLLSFEAWATYGRYGTLEPTITYTIRLGKEGEPEEAFSLSSARLKEWYHHLKYNS